MKKRVLLTILIGLTKQRHVCLVSVLTLCFAISAVAQPAISSVSPLSGMPGSTVTITGTGFNTTPANDVVYFGATRAVVTSASSTSLSVTVPSGATYAPVTVENLATSLTAFSRLSFLPTYDHSAYPAGAIGFDRKVNFAASGPKPIQTLIEDVDGDGKPDMVVLDSLNISVYRNTGTSGSISSGSFAPMVSFALPTHLHTYSFYDGGYFNSRILMAAGDIDGDGKKDIVYSTGNDSICVIRNTSTTGSVNFSAPVFFMSDNTLPTNQVNGVAIGDLDGDGKADIVSTNQNYSISVFHNTASPGSITTGSLSTPMMITIPGSIYYFLPVGVAIGDIDGDGKPELAVTTNTSEIDIFPNISTPGTISLGAAVTIVSNGGYVLIPYPYMGDTLFSRSAGVCFNDIDGDGKLDLVVANNYVNSISVLRNTATPGTINAGSFAAGVAFPSAYDAAAIAAGDFDGDGKTDLAVTGGYASSIFGFVYDMSVYIYRNTSSPGVINGSSFVVTTTPVGGNDMRGIAVGDLDGDGKPDLVTSIMLDNNVSVLRNAPVAPVVITSVNPIIAAPGTTATITGNNFGTTAADNIVYFGATRATVAAASATSLSVTVPLGATYERVSAINATNGLGAYSDGTFLPTFNDPLCVPGTVIFESPVMFPSSDITMPRRVRISDIDGDGKADAIVNMDSGFVYYRNTSASGTIDSSSFAAPVRFGSVPYSFGITVGDVDGDGKPDVVTGTWLGFVIYRNTSAPGSASFAPPVFFPDGVGGGLVSFAIADMNGDGKADIVAGSGSVGASIFWNTGTAGVIDSSSMTPAADYTLSDGAWSESIAVGDIDGDGRPDIAVTNTVNKVFVYRNSLQGFDFYPTALTLGTPSAYINDIVIADVDGDGKPDIAVTNGQDSNIIVLRNTATIGVIDTFSFAAPVSFRTPPEPLHLAVGDFNGDNKPDLLVSGVADYTNQVVSVFLNTATAGVINSSSFAARVDSPVVYSVWATAGDIDNDGKSDIVTCVYANPPATIHGSIAVLRNNPHVPAITGNAPICVGAMIQLHNALGGGNWSSSEFTVSVGSAGLITGVSAGTASITYTYLPGFIATTIVTVNPGGLPHITSVSPMKGNVASSVTITGTNFSTTTSEDVTYFGATKANVVSASSTVLNVTVPSGATYMPVTVTNPTCGLTGYAGQSFLQTYDNSPYLSGTVHLDTKVDLVTGPWAYVLALSDLDGDGKADMVATSATSNTVWVYLNTSSSGSITGSSFAAPVVIPVGNTPTGITTADIDGDGKPDLAVVTAGDATVSVLRNTSSPGSVSFDAPVVSATGGGGAMVAVSDIDGDGIPDMAVANSADHTVSIFHGVSAPGVISFRPQVVLSAGSTPHDVLIRDIDGDGKPDLTVSNIDGASIFMWRNLSSPGSITSGSFASPLTFVTGGSPTGLSIGDIDGDGKPDMVIADENDNDVSVFRNTSSTGVISFATRVTFATGSVPMGTIMSDIDGDGKPDLSVANNDGGTVSVLRNIASIGSISYAAGETYSSGGGPYSVVSGDIDGDGKPDLAILNNGSSTISVLRNNPVPVSGILGTPTVCVGSTTTLSYYSGGGEWASSPTGVAVVGSSTGVVTGISAGTATITYYGPFGFSTMQQVTVNASPASISGASSIDVGTSVTLSDATVGGSWSSNPISIATIDPTGTVTGIAAGSAIISYTLPEGCVATQTLNVNPAVLLPGSIRSGIVSTYAPFLAEYGSWGLVVDSSNNIYVADAVTSTVKKISRSGIVTVVAGNGTAGYSGDGGPAIAAQLSNPAGMALDASGNLYIADFISSVVRKVNTSGIITTVAGSTWGYSSGDGGPATAATLAGPYYIAVDSKGNLYITDDYNANVRKVDTSGIITTIAGFPGALGGPITGFSGDGGPATNALLNFPGQITVDAHQNVYVNDINNNRVRKIDSAGIITTIAGNGTYGDSGDWGPADLASITRCNGLKTDIAGNIYLTGGVTGEHIRKINPAGIITTIAGTTPGYSGDGGPASLGSFNITGPFDFDRYGNMFLADLGNHVIREIKYHADVFADSFSVFIDNHCGALNFSTETNPTAATTLTTDFGDGTSTTTPLSPGDPGTMYASVPHVYSAPGTYSVKEVLWDGATAVDSILFSHQYLLCNNFAVQFYYDNNGNCAKDGDETWSFPPVTVEVDSNGIAVDTQTATSGIYYTAFGNPGDIYSFKVISAPAGLVPTCSGSGIVYDTLQSIIYHVTNNYIGFTCSSTPGFDLTEHMSSIAGRHTATGTVVVNNNYCTPQAGVVTLNINPKFSFSASVPSPSSVSGNVVTWNMTGLSSMLAPHTINYTLERTGTWLTPGDTILSVVRITPVTGDADTTNNTIARIDTVKSSFDPNEISVIPGGYILPGTYLQYTINFENTGNDTAHNIAVMDTLPDNLDVNTLRIDAATAVMNTAIYKADGHNIIKFDFPHINLLDSTHHNECTGMVIFHIKTKSGLGDGATMFNQAGIFFDDNPVVITNTVENIISLIHGPDHVCVGAHFNFSEVPADGVWVASNVTASISRDTVTGVTAGIDTFTYTTTTKYGSASVTKIVTVNASPAPITGPSSGCEGTSIVLSDATPGGTWSVDNVAVATIGSTGIVTGISAGTVNITCGISTGCIATKVVTFNPLPMPVSGTATACAGSSITLSDATIGGIWSSSNPAVGTVGSEGTVAGLSAGTTRISYTLATGCSSNVVVTISPMPSVISGITAVCTGSSSPLSDAVGGGTWGSSNTAVATIGATTGVVTGVTAGTTNISYKMSPGCFVSTVVTVNSTPAAITANHPVCAGSLLALTDATTGGTWSSSNPGVASVGSGTPMVSGNSGGTASISYILPSGCFTTTVVTINPLPGSIGGIFSACTGATFVLTDASPGGIWSSSSSKVSVGTGSITGVTAGTALITYTLPTGCKTTVLVTVNGSPAPITGVASVCAGLATALTDATAGGAWSSSNVAAGTVSVTGVVTGIATGSTIISYILTNGCTATATFTVNAMPTPIGGTPYMCNGSATLLTDALTGGTWSSSSPVVASVSSGGLVSGADVGTAVITYSAAGCIATREVTVNTTPTSISGVTILCAGDNTALSNGVAGGTWSSAAPAIATIGSTGVVTAVSAGTSVITYALSTGCKATTRVTVNPTPTPIGGTPYMCNGSSTLLTDALIGGTWSSSSPVVASVSSGGLVSGADVGTAVITYSAAGCIATREVTVNTTPTSISGVTILCAGDNTALSNGVAGGTWSSAAPAIATIGSTGVVTAVSAGTAVITYALGTGCKATTRVTVNPTPASISGITYLCNGSTTLLTDALAGGTWSSSDVIIAAISSGGLVSGSGVGTATITYSSATGCIATQAVTVNSTPTPISGVTILCAGDNAVLSDTIAGGTWSSAASAIATIGATGVVTAVSAGTAVITYALSTGCNATTRVTVNPTPAPISGIAYLCNGSTTLLTDALAGGTWSSSDVIAAISSGGLVSGSGVGTATITYSSAAGCIATQVVTVNEVPAAISGLTLLCAGDSATLSDTVAGGAWSSATPAIATISAAGVLTAVSSGTAVITYTLGSGCSAVTIVTVNLTPPAIAGTTIECIGMTTALSDVEPGGAWSSSSSAIASVSTSGIVTGVSAGTVNISYAFPSGCYTFVINTVNPLPSAIMGASGVCVGSATPLTVSPAGGNWMSSSPSIATVNATGIVSGVSGGTAMITYTLPSGCYTTLIVTVSTSPGLISGVTALCAGSTTDLSDVTPGGTWSSSTPGIATVATIGASTGIVIGISAGVDTISYIVSAGCVATVLVTVYATPVVTMVASSAACGGAYDLVAAGAVSYYWSPGVGIACNTCASNTVRPMTATVYTVTGTGANGCMTTESITVNPNKVAGHIAAGGLATDAMKVWLIQFNPADSSLITQDSMFTCMDGGMPYYEFDSVVPGNYLVRAKLISSVPGVTGYAPTYGAFSAHWNAANAIVHTSATDTQHINMVYGVVPPGVGSIEGFIMSGAGRGTSGEIAVVGMLVYLLNGSGQVVTYTYTDAVGAYSFTGLGGGIYTVYPEDYKYYTTESTLISLSGFGEMVTNVNFKQHTLYGTITPYSNVLVSAYKTDNGIGIYPNPATAGYVNLEWSQQTAGNAVVSITDMAGREVYNSAIEFNTTSGQAQINVSTFAAGVYIIAIKSADTYFKCKLVIE